MFHWCPKSYTTHFHSQANVKKANVYFYSACRRSHRESIIFWGQSFSLNAFEAQSFGMSERTFNVFIDFAAMTKMKKTSTQRGPMARGLCFYLFNPEGLKNLPNLLTHMYSCLKRDKRDLCNAKNYFIASLYVAYFIELHNLWINGCILWKIPNLCGNELPQKTLFTDSK